MERLVRSVTRCDLARHHPDQVLLRRLLRSGCAPKPTGAAEGHDRHCDHRPPRIAGREPGARPRSGAADPAADACGLGPRCRLTTVPGAATLPGHCLRAAHREVLGGVGVSRGDWGRAQGSVQPARRRRDGGRLRTVLLRARSGGLALPRAGARPRRPHPDGSGRYHDRCARVADPGRGAGRRLGCPRRGRRRRDGVGPNEGIGPGHDRGHGRADGDGRGVHGAVPGVPHRGRTAAEASRRGRRRAYGWSP